VQQGTETEGDTRERGYLSTASDEVCVALREPLGNQAATIVQPIALDERRWGCEMTHTVQDGHFNAGDMLRHFAQ